MMINSIQFIMSWIYCCFEFDNINQNPWITDLELKEIYALVSSFFILH